MDIAHILKWIKKPAQIFANKNVKRPLLIDKRKLKVNINEGKQ